MAPLVVGGIVRVALTGQNAAGRQVVNLIDVHVDTEEAGQRTAELVQAKAEDVRDAWQDHVLDVLGNAYTFTGGNYLDLDSLDGSSGEFSPDPGKPTVGALTVAQHSPNVAVLVHKNLQGGNRTTRSGRMYLMGSLEPDMDGSGLWSTGFVDAVNTAMEAFKDAVNGQYLTPEPHDANLAVAHAPEGQPTSFHTISTFTCDPRAATQRRRLRG